MDAIELLTADEDGNAIQGPMYPTSYGTGTVRWLPEDESVGAIRLAYLHKFFRYDESGRPVPDTLVKFLVPDYMCRDDDGLVPDRYALRLVAERMGWT